MVAGSMRKVQLLVVSAAVALALANGASAPTDCCLADGSSNPSTPLIGCPPCAAPAAQLQHRPKSAAAEIISEIPWTKMMFVVLVALLLNYQIKVGGRGQIRIGKHASPRAPPSTQQHAHAASPG